jgi:hypothetical protein
MIEYRGRFFFDGQDVNRNITEQLIIDMKAVVWQYRETTQLALYNVGGNEFSVSIKAGKLTNLWRFQKFHLSLVIVAVFTRLIIR